MRTDLNIDITAGSLAYSRLGDPLGPGRSGEAHERNLLRKAGYESWKQVAEADWVIVRADWLDIEIRASGSLVDVAA
jgi:hypothetical protein